MSKDIEIKIQGANVTPEKFLRVAKAFFDLVQGVSKNIQDEGMSWTVEVAAGSSVVRTRSDDPAAEVAIRAITRGINSLQSGIQTMPPMFGRDELIAARTLAAMVDNASITLVLTADALAPEALSPAMLATADAILDAGASLVFGSIEGVIDTLSLRDGFKCGVFEANYGRGVKCVFTKTQLEEEALKAFGKRVLVSGMMKYSKEGAPTTMHADSLRIFPEASELPTLQEIQAVYREIYQ